MRALALALFGLSVAPALVVAAGCTTAGCTTPAGDQPADAGAPSPLGSGLRLRQITPPLMGDSTDGFPANPMHPVQNQIVSVTGVSVVTIDAFDETHNGKSIGSLYVEDVGSWLLSGSQAAYAGIECYSTLYEPASLKVSPGDVIDLYGEYQDFTGPSTSPFPAGQVLPEMGKPTATFRFEYNAPTPVVIDVNDLDVLNQADYDKGARWLGMLVEVDNVTLTTPLTADSEGRVSGQIATDITNGAGIDNELYDMKVTDFPGGTKFSKVIGVVTYFYDYHIAPRSPADLVVSQLGTGTADAGD
jgi:hypothetical protein